MRERLQEIRRGHIVHARGYLVDADHESGFRWQTSLSREDTGDGACELFYVERIEIEEYELVAGKARAQAYCNS